MSLMVVIGPHGDPTDENISNSKKTLSERIKSFPDGPIEFELEQTDHGIGAGWETITLVIGLFFGIPAFHKKIRESISEWRKISQLVMRFIDWIKKDNRIVSYSKEFALIRALEILEGQVDVDDLEFCNFIEIAGKSGGVNINFKTTELFYFQFIFREGNEKLFILLFNSKLELLSAQKYLLDPRY